jgi:hypothetical protein
MTEEPGAGKPFIEQDCLCKDKMGLLQKLAEQHRQPKGLLGKLMGLQMGQASRQANHWAISLIAPSQLKRSSSHVDKNY